MKRVILVVATAVALTGCITFNGKELPKVTPEKLERPTAVIEIKVEKFDKLMNGSSEGFGANFNEGALGRSITKLIVRYWKTKNLINDFGFPGDLDKVATHRLIINGTADEVGSLSGAFITGLTLYLFPSTTDLVYDIHASLERLSDGAVYEVNAKNSITLVQQIFFLPTTVFGSVIWGTYGASRDRSLFLYEEFRKAGAFDESLLLLREPAAGGESIEAP